MIADKNFDFGFAPWRLSGTVYGALLNHRPQLAALGDAVHAAPYKAAPAFPVLQVRPRNTFSGHDAVVALPADPGCVDVGVSLGIVIGRTACRITQAEALSFVAAYLTVAELGLPQDQHYRPAVRFKARDGFTVLGKVVAAEQVPDPDALLTHTRVNSIENFRGNTGDRVRSVAALLSAVTEFMTLQAGDVLLLGASAAAPQARAGDTVEVAVQGVG
ncbi:MAG: hypothetical protein RLZZ591_2842, partial [Pseudomonadota bacterium]